MRVTQYLVGGALALMTAACGGGGGADTGPSAPAVSSKAVLTSQNMVSVSSAAYGSQDAVSSSVSAADVAYPTGTFGQVDLAHAGRRAALAAASVACANTNGSLKVTGPGSPTTGDTVRIQAEQCKLEDGSTIHGTLAMRYDTWNPGTSEMGFTMTMTDFAMVDAAGLRATLNGSMSIAMRGLAQVNITVPALTAVTSGTGMAVTETYANYGIAGLINPNGSTSVSLSGTYSSTHYGGGLLQLVQESPFVVAQNATHPSSGVLVMQGQQSAVKLEALSGAQARVSVDSNGDGTYEDAKTVDWATLAL